MEISKVGIESGRQNNRQLGFRFDKERTEAELAYYAGFFDGEGNIDIWRKAGSYTMRTQVSQKPRDILASLRVEFGGSIYPLKNGSHIWALHGKKAKAFLEVILPYLKLKRRQAELAIEYQELVHRKYGRTHVLAHETVRGKRILAEFNTLRNIKGGR